MEEMMGERKDLEKERKKEGKRGSAANLYNETSAGVICHFRR